VKRRGLSCWAAAGREERKAPAEHLFFRRTPTLGLPPPLPLLHSPLLPFCRSGQVDRRRRGFALPAAGFAPGRVIRPSAAAFVVTDPFFTGFCRCVTVELTHGRLLLHSDACLRHLPLPSLRFCRVGGGGLHLLRITWTYAAYGWRTSSVFTAVHGSRLLLRATALHRTLPPVLNWSCCSALGLV